MRLPAHPSKIAFEGKNRLVDVDERPELINVRVAVAVERVEGVKIERGGDGFVRQGPGLVLKVVVAVDQNSRGRIGDNLRQLGSGDVGQGKMLGAFDVEQSELGVAASVKDDCARLGGQAEKIRFRNTALLPKLLNLRRVLQEALVIDERIRLEFFLADCHAVRNAEGDQDERDDSHTAAPECI